MAAKGWTRTSQRRSRYKYQKVLAHTTNPDHLVPSTPSLTPPGVSTVIWESGCADRVSPGWWTGVIRVGCP
jgi:hypothetical protein